MSSSSSSEDKAIYFVLLVSTDEEESENDALSILSTFLLVDIRGESRCAALYVANGAMRRVQANMNTGLISPAMTISKATIIYITFLSIAFKF